MDGRGHRLHAHAVHGPGGCLLHGRGILHVGVRGHVYVPGHLHGHRYNLLSEPVRGDGRRMLCVGDLRGEDGVGVYRHLAGWRNIVLSRPVRAPDRSLLYQRRVMLGHGGRRLPVSGTLARGSNDVLAESVRLGARCLLLLARFLRADNGVGLPDDVHVDGLGSFLHAKPVLGRGPVLGGIPVGLVSLKGREMRHGGWRLADEVTAASPARSGGCAAAARYSSTRR